MDNTTGRENEKYVLNQVLHSKEPSMGFLELLKAVEHASSFDLWRLTRAIDEMLKDPARIHAIKSRLRMNQEVVYFDARENREIHATIVEIHRTNVLVKTHDGGRLWQIPFYMLNLENEKTETRTQPQRIDRSTLKVGDQVGFLNRSSQVVSGAVTKLNPKAAEVLLPTGERWRIHYHALFYVFEGECRHDENKILIDKSP